MIQSRAANKGEAPQEARVQSETEEEAATNVKIHVFTYCKQKAQNVQL